MNISTVNELIQSLESAGELSIKERKYLELAKAYVQPTAEMIWAAKYCFTSTPGWDVFKSAYIAMLAAAPQPQNAPQNIPEIIPGWIPVSERMPEMGEQQCYVLAADFKNHYWPNIPNTQVGVYGDWFDDGNPTWDDGDGEDLHLKEVTHWMPLPAAPQEVKGE
ncbi:TPA: DUF551 domain-containing protein [Raoultella planticola]